MTGEKYKELLEQHMGEFLEEVPLADRNKIWWQQDGAGPHNARTVSEYLRDTFGER